MKPSPSALLLVAPLLAASAAAFGAYNEPPKGEVTKTDNFTWADPFSSHRLKKLEARCTAERTFAASEFLLHDLFEKEPQGLWSYGDALKKSFSGRPYPGGWDGLDPHMYERPLLLMAYSDVPMAVREWIEDQERSESGPGKHLFAVFERAVEADKKVTKTVAPQKSPEKAAMFRPLDAKRVAIFAPGALYGILPLWAAAEGSGSGKGGGCADLLRDLGRYTPKPKDGAVIAWTTLHTAPNRSKGERAITFTIKAQALTAAAAGAAKDHIKSDKEEL